MVRKQVEERSLPAIKIYDVRTKVSPHDLNRRRERLRPTEAVVGGTHEKGYNISHCRVLPRIYEQYFISYLDYNGSRRNGL